MPSNRKKKKKKGGQPKSPSRGDNQPQKLPASQGGASCLSAHQGEDSYSAAAESCVKGYSGEDLIARYNGGTWEDPRSGGKGFVPNWTKQECRDFTEAYGEEDAVGKWMESYDEEWEAEEELEAAGWTDRERAAFARMFGRDPIEIQCEDLREEMRERLPFLSKKLEEGKDDWMAKRKAARTEKPKPKATDTAAVCIPEPSGAPGQEPQPEPAEAGAAAANVPDADLGDRIQEQRRRMLEMEQLLAAAQAELVSKERRLESVEAELILEKGLRQEFEADCEAAEEKAERCAEKVEEAERLKKERKCWLKEQLKWKKDREAMQKTIDILAEHADVGLQGKLTAAEAKVARLERELFEANEKILEVQQERLAAMDQQSRQFDRGKTNVCAR
eukprot:COSAG01_NODE_7350_length_3241_cov_3.263845_2_plen_389_part_00